jgi:hypothetical protein
MIPDGVRLRGACLVIHPHQNNRKVTFDVLVEVSLLEN